MKSPNEDTLRSIARLTRDADFQRFADWLREETQDAVYAAAVTPDNNEVFNRQQQGMAKALFFINTTINSAVKNMEELTRKTKEPVKSSADYV